MTINRSTLKVRLKDYNFFHTIDLGNGIKTPGRPLPEHKKMLLESIASQDLTNKRVLDIGCNNGLFSFEAEKHGATDILAVDHTDAFLKPMRELLIPYLNSNVKVARKNLLELKCSELGQFDVIIFAGLLYHLRYPFWSLKVVRDLLVEGGLLFFETAVLIDDNSYAMLWCPSPSDSPYRARGANSCSFFNSKALGEMLTCLGIEVISYRLSRPTDSGKARGLVRRFAIEPLRQIKRMMGKHFGQSIGPRPLKRAVLLCRRKSDLADPKLLNFYDGLS